MSIGFTLSLGLCSLLVMLFFIILHDKSMAAAAVVAATAAVGMCLAAAYSPACMWEQTL